MEPAGKRFGREGGIAMADVSRQAFATHYLHIVVEGSDEMFSAHNGHETPIEIMRPVTAA